MKQAELIKRIRERIELCRRLAVETIDPRTADALIQMANEGEEDVQRLLVAVSPNFPQPIEKLSATLIEASAQSAHPVPLSAGIKA